MKFVPLSDLQCLTGPCMARKRLKALMKLEVDIGSITSRWTTLVIRQAKMTAHLLLSAAPPRVRRVVTLNSTPENIKPYMSKRWVICQPVSRQIRHLLNFSLASQLLTDDTFEYDTRDEFPPSYYPDTNSAHCTLCEVATLVGYLIMIVSD